MFWNKKGPGVASVKVFYPCEKTDCMARRKKEVKRYANQPIDYSIASYDSGSAGPMYVCLHCKHFVKPDLYDPSPTGCE